MASEFPVPDSTTRVTKTFRCGVAAMSNGSLTDVPCRIRRLSSTSSASSQPPHRPVTISTGKRLVELSLSKTVSMYA